LLLLEVVVEVRHYDFIESLVEIDAAFIVRFVVQQRLDVLTCLHLDRLLTCEQDVEGQVTHHGEVLLFLLLPEHELLDVDAV